MIYINGLLITISQMVFAFCARIATMPYNLEYVHMRLDKESQQQGRNSRRATCGNGRKSPGRFNKQPRSLERGDVRVHLMQARVRCFLQLVHACMKLGHLVRNNLLACNRAINSLVHIVDPLVQSEDGRQHVADGCAAAVLGRRWVLLPWGHDIIIMPVGLEISKGLGPCA